MNTAVSSLMYSGSCSTRERDPTSHVGAWRPGDVTIVMPQLDFMPSTLSLVRSGAG